MLCVAKKEMWGGGDSSTLTHAHALTHAHSHAGEKND
jgi:hypothetical protein